jgi:hypothetical protein
MATTRAMLDTGQCFWSTAMGREGGGAGRQVQWRRETLRTKKLKCYRGGVVIERLKDLEFSR